MIESLSHRYFIVNCPCVYLLLFICMHAQTRVREREYQKTEETKFMILLDEGFSLRKNNKKPYQVEVTNVNGAFYGKLCKYQT